MGLFARKSEAAPEESAKSKAAPEPPTLEALGRKLDALTRRCEAAEAANALALVIISDMLHDPKAGPLGVRLEAASQAVEFKSASAGIQALLGRISKAGDADGARQRRHASGRLQVHAGAGGRNF